MTAGESPGYRGFLFTVDSNGNMWWETDNLGSSAGGTPAIGALGSVFFGLYNGWFYSLTLTGGENWSIPTYDINVGSPAITADDWLVFQNKTRLYALDNYTGGPAPTSWPMYRANQKRKMKKTP